MSSMVSRSPPVLGSVSQAKDLRWMSIRLGSSRGVSRRANDRRVRGASTEAKAATPRGGGERRAGALYNLKWLESATSKDSTGDRRPREGPSALTDPALGSAYVARIPAYRAAATIGRQPRSVGRIASLCHSVNRFSPMRLYVVAASHPCYAVEAALRLKGLDYDRVVLPIGLSAPLQLARFGRRTVPGLITDEGYRVVGSRLIMRALDGLAPDPPLLPA